MIGEQYYFFDYAGIAHVGRVESIDTKRGLARLVFGAGTHINRLDLPMTELHKYTPGVPWTAWTDVVE